MIYPYTILFSREPRVRWYHFEKESNKRRAARTMRAVLKEYEPQTSHFYLMLINNRDECLRVYAKEYGKVKVYIFNEPLKLPEYPDSIYYHLEK